MKQKKKQVSTEETIKNRPIEYLIYYVLIFVITTLCVIGIGILLKRTQAQLIRNTVLIMLGCSCIILVMAKTRLFGEYEYDNEKHPLRFFVVYLIGLAMSFICPFLPVTGWPFMAIAIAISLLSNWLIGLTISSIFIMISVTMAGVEPNVFMLYFTVCLVGIILFHKLNEDFAVGVPIGVSLLNLLVVETACTIIFINENLSLEMFVIPIINLFVTSVLLAIFLRYFAVKIIHRSSNDYIEVNDQQFPLLVELKNYSKEDYYNAIHTAYFCSLIAKKIHADENIAKAGGYYHRINKIKEGPPLLVMEELCNAYKLPKAAKEMLLEYADLSNGIQTKETAIVYFSDAVVSSIVCLFQKDATATINYVQLVNTIFEKKLSSGLMQYCNMTLRELTIMKNIFLEEKLYYDFLR